mmetsp:Transcript_45338/g.81087  ORF Transcript_45338/g.81087 Transcript_45338/m.81087 type:complete len:258 (+) Transcript_45338:303-1076(+)
MGPQREQWGAIEGEGDRLKAVSCGHQPRRGRAQSESSAADCGGRWVCCRAKWESWLSRGRANRGNGGDRRRAGCQRCRRCHSARGHGCRGYRSLRPDLLGLCPHSPPRRREQGRTRGRIGQPAPSAAWSWAGLPHLTCPVGPALRGAAAVAFDDAAFPQRVPRALREVQLLATDPTGGCCSGQRGFVLHRNLLCHLVQLVEHLKGTLVISPAVSNVVAGQLVNNILPVGHLASRLSLFCLLLLHLRHQCLLRLLVGH